MIYLADYRKISEINYSDNIVLLVTQNKDFSLLPDMIKFSLLNLPQPIYEFIKDNTNEEDIEIILKDIFEELLVPERYNTICNILNILQDKTNILYIFLDNYPNLYFSCLCKLLNRMDLQCKIWGENE